MLMFSFAFFTLSPFPDPVEKFFVVLHQMSPILLALSQTQLSQKSAAQNVLKMNNTLKQNVLKMNNTLKQNVLKMKGQHIETKCPKNEGTIR
jgi:hypothetical protein